jgi:circadian clock protein KaiC
MSFALSACKRRERALVFAYEESEHQLIRNMRSIGLDLATCIRKKQMLVHATRPTLAGLEQHLVMMHDVIEEYDPSVVVVDPISNLTIEGEISEVKPTLLRLIDLIKRRNITAIFTSLTGEGLDPVIETSEVGVSSVMDTWIALKNVEHNGERNRTLIILKSRGMKHSNQVREFVMTDHGIELVDVYLGADRVLTGTARVAQAESERVASELRKLGYEKRQAEMEVKRKAIEAQIAALHAESATRLAESALLAAQFDRETKADSARTELMSKSRSAIRKGKRSKDRR